MSIEIQNTKSYVSPLPSCEDMSPSPKRKRITITELELQRKQETAISVRRDSLQRRVSSWGDQDTLDLEEEVFSPSAKINDRKRSSLTNRMSFGADTDSSYSSFIVTQELSNVIDSALDIGDFSEVGLRPSQGNGSSAHSSQQEEKEQDTIIASVKQEGGFSPISLIENGEFPSDEELITMLNELDEESYSLFIVGTLPPFETIYLTPRTSFALPPKSQSQPTYTLVLDLDETLVHCVMEPIEHYDIAFDIQYSGSEMRIYGSLRPYLDEFLEEASKLFEIVVFTASRECYAKEIMKIIDKKGVVSSVLSRTECVLVEDNYIKDLECLGRDLRHTVLIDNSYYAFGYQINNGIPIRSWFDDRLDRELKDLIPVLKEITEQEDVRPFLQSRYHVQERVNQVLQKFFTRTSSNE